MYAVPFYLPSLKNREIKIIYRQDACSTIIGIVFSFLWGGLLACPLFYENCYFALNFNKFNNFNRNLNTSFDHVSEFIPDARNINLPKEDNMVSQTTQPVQSVPSSPQVPRFDGNDPFWIIIAIAVLVKVLVGNQTTRSHKP
jgi:hypothetical protein